jgi:hypothetical protein
LGQWLCSRKAFTDDGIPHVLQDQNAALVYRLEHIEEEAEAERLRKTQASPLLHRSRYITDDKTQNCVDKTLRRGLAGPDDLGAVFSAFAAL